MKTTSEARAEMPLLLFMLGGDSDVDVDDDDLGSEDYFEGELELLMIIESAIGWSTDEIDLI